MMVANDTPRVYVACLASYNAGVLKGEWLDAVDADELEAGIEEMLKGSACPPAEEWAIHDSEGFGSWRVGEYEDLATLCAVGAAIVEHGAVAADLVAGGFCAAEDVATYIDEHLLGTWADMEDYAYDLVESCGVLERMPDDMRCYFDYEAYGRDLEMNGDVFTMPADGGIYVFRNR